MNKVKKQFGFCYVSKRGDVMKNNKTPILRKEKLKDPDNLLHLMAKWDDRNLTEVLKAYCYACKLNGIQKLILWTYYDD